MRAGRITARPEITPKRQNGGYFRMGHNSPAIAIHCGKMSKLTTQAETFRTELLITSRSLLCASLARLSTYEAGRRLSRGDPF